MPNPKPKPFTTRKGGSREIAPSAKPHKTAAPATPKKPAAQAHNKE